MWQRIFKKFGKREIKFWWQRRTRKWDDSETWNLDMVVTKFTLPRLKRFREINAVSPEELTEKEWDSILNQMIFAFETFDDHWNKELTEEEWRKIDRGFQLFGKWYMRLWW